MIPIVLLAAYLGSPGLLSPRDLHKNLSGQDLPCRSFTRVYSVGQLYVVGPPVQTPLIVLRTTDGTPAPQIIRSIAVENRLTASPINVWDNPNGFGTPTQINITRFRAWNISPSSGISFQQAGVMGGGGSISVTVSDCNVNPSSGSTTG